MNPNRRWLVATGAIALALAFYCSGRAEGKRGVTAVQIQAQRDTIMDTVRVVEERLRVDTVRVRETARIGQERRAAFDSVARAVTALVDTAPTAAVALALPAIQVCQQAIAADTIAYRAVVTELRDMTEDRDAQRRRADDDERELNLGRPRFGFRAGIAVGAGMIAVIVGFLR